MLNPRQMIECMEHTATACLLFLCLYNDLYAAFWHVILHLLSVAQSYKIFLFVIYKVENQKCYPLQNTNAQV
jgi:hypothetical protein